MYNTNKVQPVPDEEELYPSYKEQQKGNLFQGPWVKQLTLLLSFIFIITLCYSRFIIIAAPLLGVIVGLRVLKNSVWSKSVKMYFIILNLKLVILAIHLKEFPLYWVVDYVFPLLLMAMLVTLSLLMLLKSSCWERYVGVQVYTVVMAVGVLFLPITRIASLYWPSIATVTVGFLTMVFGALVFGRDYGVALQKFLHV